MALDLRSCTRLTLFLLLLFVPLLAAGCGKKGSGNKAVDTRELGAFTKVSVKGFAKLRMHVDPSAEAAPLVVSGDDDVVPLLKTTVVDDTLKIEFEEEVRPNLPLEVSGTVPSLAALKVSGAVDAGLTGLSGAPFELTVSGAARTVVGGRTSSLSMRISGAAKVDAGDLVAEKVTLRLSGAGDVLVNATAELDLNLSGAARVRYRGDPPKVVKEISGAGVVSKE